MEVLKVKIDFEKPSSGSIPESPKICLTRFYRQTTGEDLGHLKDLTISKYKRFFSLERP
jgi:hypothetical protein